MLLGRRSRKDMVSNWNKALLVITLAWGGSAEAGRDIDYGWIGTASLGGSITTGNTDTSNINASLKETYRGKQWHHKVELGLLESRDQGRATAQRYLASYRLMYRLYPDVNFFSDLRWVADEFAGYDSQVYETFGYGHRLVDGLWDTFEIELGVGLNQNKLTSNGTESSTVLRAGYTYRHDFENGNRFDSTLLVLRSRENTHTLFTASIKAKLVGDLSLELQETVSRNSQVLPDKTNTDTTTSVGLVYAF